MEGREIVSLTASRKAEGGLLGRGKKGERKKVVYYLIPSSRRYLAQIKEENKKGTEGGKGSVPFNRIPVPPGRGGKKGGKKGRKDSSPPATVKRRREEEKGEGGIPRREKEGHE